MVEEQKIEDNQDQADKRDEHAGCQCVLTKGRTNDLALLVLEAHGQRAGLKDGLQGLGFLQGVVAGNGNLAAGDLGLNGRRALNLTVEDDDDLTLIGCKLLGGLGESLGALGVELDVNGVVGTGLGSAINADAGDVLAGDQRGVAALDAGIRGLGALEGVAEIVGEGLLACVAAAGDCGFVLIVGERIGTSELKDTRLADGVQSGLRVGHAGNLNQNLVVALNLHNSLGSTERVDAALDDGAGFLKVF